MWRRGIFSPGFASGILRAGSTARLPAARRPRGVGEGTANRQLRSIMRWQVGASVTVTVLAAAAGGGDAALSALVGAASVCLPAWIIFRRLLRGDATSPGFFFLVEGLKLAASVTLLVGGVSLLPRPVWPALFAGLLVAAKSPLLVLTRWR